MTGMEIPAVMGWPWWDDDRITRCEPGINNPSGPGTFSGYPSNFSTDYGFYTLAASFGSYLYWFLCF